MSNNKIFALFFTVCILMFFYSCKSDSNSDKLLAKVGKKELHLSDIYFPENMEQSDSLIFLKNNVEKWVMEQLVYAEALENLSEEKKAEIEKQVDKIHSNMLVSAQEEKVIADSLKTNISDEELIEYYNANSNDFKLTENIVKLMYVKLNKKNSDLDGFKKLLKDNSSGKKAELLKKAQNESLNFFLEDNVWLYFNDILKEIPIKTENQEAFLKENKYFEVSTDSIVYLVVFKDYMLSNSPAPFIMVKDRIESIIFAMKKNNFLSVYRNKLYQEASKNKKIKIYID